MTTEDKNIIKNEIIEQLELESKLIDDLTPVEQLSDDDLFEINGGRNVTFAKIRSASQAGLSEAISEIVGSQTGLPNLIVPVDAQYNEIGWDKALESDGSGGIKAKALKAKLNFYSLGDIAALGPVSTTGASGNEGAALLSELDDVLLTNPTNGQVLVYNGTNWVNRALGGGLDESALQSYLDLHQYAKLTDIPSLSGYALESWVTAQGYLTQADKYTHPSYTPRAVTDSVGKFVSAASVDALGHVTALSARSLVADDIPGLPWSKITSGKPSTLAGYGITDAYTKSEADGIFLTKATFDDLFEKVVVNGVTAIKAKYHFYSVGDIAALGPVSSGGTAGGGASLLSQLDDVLLTSPMAGHALVYDGTHWINQAINPGLDESALATYLAANQYARISDIPSLTGYATEIWVQSQGYALASSLSDKADKTTKISAGTGLTGGGTLAADRTLSLATSGVTAGTYTKLTVDAYGRATAGASLVASDIPSLDWGKITTGKPTTLAGYGITDAYTKTDADNRYVNVTGDMMSGLLNITMNSLTLTLGAQNSSFIHIYTSDTSKPFAINPSGVAMVGNGTLGTPGYRAGNVYSVLGDFSSQVTAGSLKLGGSSGGLITWDAANNAFKFHGNLCATGDIAALGPTSSTGGASGGGLIQSVYGWGDLGGTFSNSNLTDTFNAYTINKLYADKADKSWVEGKGYITSSALSNYVDKTSDQEISGVKTFTNPIESTFSSDTWLNGVSNAVINANYPNYGAIFNAPVKDGRISLSTYPGTTNLVYLGYIPTGQSTNMLAKKLTWNGATGALVADSFIKSGGTSSQFLKANGDVDSNTYLIASEFNSSVLSCFGWASRATSFTWGNQTGTALSVFNDSTGGSIGFRRDNPSAGKMSAIIDGFWYQQEGQYRCIDTSDYTDANVLSKIKNVDGNGSGLDADLLDGVHNGDVTAKLINYNDDGGITKQIQFMQKKTGWNTWDAPAQNWFSTMKLSHGNGDTYYSRVLAFDFFTNRIYTHCKNNGTDIGWSTLAFTTDNVASATRLQGSYSLWGQTFYGNNVNGHLSIGTILGQQMAGRAELSLISEGDYPIDIMLGRSGTRKWSISSRSSAESDYFGIYNYTNGFFRFCILENGNVGIGTTAPAYKLDVNGDVMARGWLRTTGNVGWYSQTHGGGWYMTDAVWLRTYNGKAIYSSGAIRSDTLFNRMGYDGDSWNKGYGAYNVEIRENNRQTPLMVAYRGENAAVEGANRLFALELLNSGEYLQFGFGGSHKFSMRSNGQFYASNSVLIGSIPLVYDSALGALKIEGNVYATGDIVALGATAFTGALDATDLKSFAIGVATSYGLVSIKGENGKLTTSSIGNTEMSAYGNITLTATMGKITLASGQSNLVEVNANLTVSNDIKFNGNPTGLVAQLSSIVSRISTLENKVK